MKGTIFLKDNTPELVHYDDEFDVKTKEEFIEAAAGLFDEEPGGPIGYVLDHVEFEDENRID